MVKIAILEASHWHVPLYLKAFESDDVELVAVSDPDNAMGPKIAERFSANFYQDYRTLLQNEVIDFAFVFGRHCDMLEIGTSLVKKKISFAIEKPCGVSADQVGQLRRLAEENNIYVSIPFILRSSELYQSLRDLNQSTNGNWQHMSFKFIAGPLERYIGANCSWMLDKDLASGGSTINLAVHFVDLILKLTGEDFSTVTAQMVESAQYPGVEIFSRMTLTTRGGIVCGIETGYTYPGGTKEQREFSFSLASDTLYIRSRNDGLHVVSRDGSAPKFPNIELNTDDYYPIFARNSLREFQSNSPPSINLLDMERVMVIIDAAYRSASEGGSLIKL